MLVEISRTNRSVSLVRRECIFKHCALPFALDLSQPFICLPVKLKPEELKRQRTVIEIL
jgi:hypothetical protein